MHGLSEHQRWREKERHRSHAKHEPIPKARHLEGEIGHWVRTAGILAPLLITEFVKDADKKARFIRVASIAGVILSEAFHSHKAYKDRERDREALKACEIGCASL